MIKIRRNRQKKTHTQIKKKTQQQQHTHSSFDGEKETGRQRERTCFDVAYQYTYQHIKNEKNSATNGIASKSKEP